MAEKNYFMGSCVMFSCSLFMLNQTFCDNFKTLTNDEFSENLFI